MSRKQLFARLVVTSMAFGALLVGIGGCAAGIVGLVVALIATSGEHGGGVTITPITGVSAVNPRVSAVIGGVTVRFEGRDFDAAAQVSVASIGVPMRNYSFDGITARAEVVVPFNSLPESFEDLLDPEINDDAPYLDWNEFRRRYTGSCVPTYLRVVEHGACDLYFWYLEPRLRTLLSVGGGPEYGDLDDATTVDLQGDYFGFGRDESRTHVYILRKYQKDPEGQLELVHIFRGSSDPTGPGWYSLVDCDDGGCPSDPHQGRAIRLRLPTKAEEPNLGSGPNFLIRVVNENGVDDIEIGYAPPYPPLGFGCTVQEGPQPQVQLSWNNNPANGGPFSMVVISRFDPLRQDWIPLGRSTSGSFTDRTLVQYGNYLYRVTGMIDGAEGPEESPGTTCEVAVIPQIDFDFIWDFSAQDRIVGGRRSLDGSGNAIKELLEGWKRAGGQAEGRVTLLLRPERNREALPEALIALFLNGDPRVRSTWITTGKRINFGSIDERSLGSILRYYHETGGPFYLEGQHLQAFIESTPAEWNTEKYPELAGVPTLREFVYCRLPGGKSLKRGGLGDRLVGFEVLSNVEWARGDLEIPGLYWVPDIDSMGVFGLTVSTVTREQSVLKGFGKRSLESEAIAAREFVGAAFLENSTDGCGPGALTRLLLSFLPLEGFPAVTTVETEAMEAKGLKQRSSVRPRETLFNQFISLLEPTPPPLPEVSVSDFSPKQVVWDSGQQVQIFGTGLSRIDGVYFGASLVENVSLSGSDPNAVLAVTAPALMPGQVPLTARLRAGGQIVVGQLTFTAGVPVIFGISPESGTASGGTLVTITGCNFTPPPDLQVLFDDTPAAVVDFRAASCPPDEVSARIRVLSPPHAQGTVPVSLVSSSNSVATSYRYTGGGEEPPILGPPEIISISPASGPEGENRVTIQGQGFTSDTNVLICSKPMAIESWQTGAIVGLVPPGCGTCSVKAVNYLGASVQAINYTYLPPVVTDVVPARGPSTGFQTTIQGQRFTANTKVSICGQVVGNAAVDLDAQEITVQVPPGEGTCDVSVQNVADSTSCAAVQAPKKISYYDQLLFLGRLSFSFLDTDKIRGGSQFDRYLKSLPDYVHTYLKDAPNGKVTLKFLAAYQVVVFSKMEGRYLGADEAQAFRDYVERGGGLILLGQHGIDSPDLGDKFDTKDSTDRNAIVQALGIHFRDDLFCDASSHLLYDGCTTQFEGCLLFGPETGIETPGDFDNGVEYPVLWPAKEQLHSVLSGIDVVLLPWGQSIEAKSPAEAILLGTEGSWSDQINIEYHAGDPKCNDTWFSNKRDKTEIGGVAGMAVLAHGKGRVVALGDQDMLWNQYFQPGVCLEGFKERFLLLPDRLFKNMLDWVTYRATRE